MGGPCEAGRQAQEPLVDSVRSALSSAIANHAPPVPEFPDTESRMVYLRWLGRMGDRPVSYTHLTLPTIYSV